MYTCTVDWSHKFKNFTKYTIVFTFFLLNQWVKCCDSCCDNNPLVY